MPRPVFRSAFRAIVLAWIMTLTVASPRPALAQEQVQFDVVLRGLTVARITVAARDDGTAYALAGRVRATAPAAVFARVRFDMQAEGRWAGAQPLPRRYAEDVDTGRRVSTVELSFAGPAPRVLRQDPPPDAHAVPPDEAVGMVDPLSALWRLMRSAPRDGPCNVALRVYDGARLSELLLGPRNGTEPVRCDGHYRRIAGFPPEDMAERRLFPFAVTYTRRAGQFVLTQVEAASLLGPIRIVRRD